MSHLILNTATAKRLEAIKNRPPHALLITGPAGCGKTALATELIKKIIGLSDISTYAYGRIIAPVDDKQIGIEMVRELEHFLSLKVPRPGAFNRFVTFENAHRLSIEAQNALLKTLEEPPKRTLLILTTNKEQALLPTIRSRAQVVNVAQPAKEQLRRHFKQQGYEDKVINQALFISGGLPGLMTALLSGLDHPLLEAAERAKLLLRQSNYDRLLTLEQLVKDKTLTSNIIYILQQMAHISLASASGSASKRWQQILASGYEAADAIDKNAQPKLVLTKLMLNL
jgi:replication-associated recombination protein RarA